MITIFMRFYKLLKTREAGCVDICSVMTSETKTEKKKIGSRGSDTLHDTLVSELTTGRHF